MKPFRVEDPERAEKAGSMATGNAGAEAALVTLMQVKKQATGI